MNQKSKKVCATLLASAGLLLAQNALAVDFSVIPRASIGYENYSIEWASGPVTMADLDVNLATGTIGVTATINKFYMDAYVAQSLQGSDDHTIAVNSNGVLVTLPNEWDVDVFDYAFTAGYNVWKTLAVYAGWKGHTTNMDATTNIPANWLGIQGLPAVPNAINWDVELKYSGPFIGASYGWQIGESNLLSVNAAYAWMSGDLDTVLTSQWDPNLQKSLSNLGKSLSTNGDDGDASGLTLGISWKGLITDALSYTVSADWYKYSFDGFTVQDGTVDHDIDEEAYSLRFTMSYAF